ncbi:serine/threonine-protein kinase [Streptomyces sp. NPDC059991]|uniref:serine/threonine-protein kinase n=1 Tax=Streptomyces sp. NPDC059991 TaxID=3347028 RepID=UPI0036CF347B
MAEPTVIDQRYELLTRLGSGGMGEVWEALDTALGRRVALKMIRSGLAGHEMRTRFEREAHALARIAHPNTVVVHDVGLDHEAPFLVMELLEGVDLRTLIDAEGRLPHALVRAVASGVCAGLGAVHEAGILHRDVKPGNVHLTRTGRVVLQDFGIAHLLDTSRQTATGMVVGTPSYMAPEVVRGERLGVHSDLYALGVCVHEMLSGVQPYGGESAMAVLYKIVHEPPAPLKGRPGIPDDLAELVADLMAKDPAARPTAAQTLERLRCPPNATELVDDAVTGYLRRRAVRDFGPPAAEAATAGPPVPGAAPTWPPGMEGTGYVHRAAGTALAQGAESSPDPEPAAAAVRRFATSVLALSGATRHQILRAMTPSVAEARQREAVNLVLRGSLEEAIGLLSTVAEVSRASFGPDHPTTLACVYWQGVCLARLGAGPEAVAKFAEVSAVVTPVLAAREQE